MMVKSGLEKIILKFTGGFQRYLLTCQANSVFLGRFFFALRSSNSEAKNGYSKSYDFGPLILVVLGGVGMDGMDDVQPIWLSHFLGNGHFRTRNKLSGMIIYDQ